MAVRQTILDILRRTEASSADHALVVALGRAGAETARLIAQTLLARGSREGLKGLAACWHRIDEPMRGQILAREEAVFGVLREVMNFPTDQARLNVVLVIREAGFYRAAYLLETALHDRSIAVRESAAAAMLAMAEGLLDAPVPAAFDVASVADPAEIHTLMTELESRREDRRQLAAALEAGLGSFDVHHQVAVVQAAMLCIDDLGTHIWKLLCAPGTRVVRAAQAFLAGARDIRLIPFMIQALNYAEFRPIVAQCLATCTDAAFLTTWFRQSWRLLQHRTARGFAAIRELASTKDQLRDIWMMTDDAQRHIPRCILALALAEPAKVEFLKELQRRGQPAGRRAAIWGLTRLVHESRGLAVLRSIATQEGGEHTWIARCELARRRPAEYPPRGLLAARTPGASESKPAPAGPQTAQAYWAAFDRLPEQERLSWGKRLLDEQRMTESLVKGWLVSADPGDRVRALRLVTILNIARTFESHLCELCHDGSPEVRSAVVGALGHVPTPGSRRMLQTLLYDSDARVQANAVEALERIGGPSVAAELMAKLASPDNRTRANAVKALLKLGVREAAETLLVMLEDPDRAHRASALWLVEQMNLLPVAERIRHMADSDDDEQVRCRARTLAARFGAPAEPVRPRPECQEVPA